MKYIFSNEWFLLVLYNMQLVKFLGVIGLGMSMGSSISAKNSVDFNFEHKDWQIVCDNTRTCRAAGYSPEDANNRVTVLLVRKAGIGQDVVAYVKFADIEDDNNQAYRSDKIIFKIDGRSYGEIGSLSDSKKDTINEFGSHSLNKIQTQALLEALKGTSKIVFVSDSKEWVLPGDGATAILLKMDDIQGRVGTPSALVKKGSKPEAYVLPSISMPVIYSKPIPKGNVKLWQSKVDWNVLKQELPRGKQFSDDNYCERLTEGDNEYQQFDPKVVAILPQNRLLVSGLCWRGAYNEGYGYWIINQQKPYHSKLVTTMADGVIEGDFVKSNQLSFFAKGRGLSDCVSRISWVWDGNDFVKTYDGSSGMCRMITLGGAWDLPNYIAEVK